MNMLRWMVAAGAGGGRWALPVLLWMLAACGLQSAALPNLPAATASAAPTAGAPVDLLVSGPGFEGVIFSSLYLEQDPLTAGLLVPNEGYWTPEQAQILALETQLGPYLQQAAGQSDPTIVPRLPEYKRQYAGIVRAGRQLIYINAFCQTLGIDWQRELVVVDDGGACFFSLIYDPQRGAFTDLLINGEA